jgi:hypothetical protein
MAPWRGNDEYDETPDEGYVEEEEKKGLWERLEGAVEEGFEGKGEEEVDTRSLEERGIEKKWWNENIDEIENPEVKEKRIEGAEKIIEEEKELERKLEAGEMSDDWYVHERLVVMGRKKVKFSMGADLDYIGLSWDHLIDVAEDAGNLPRAGAGDPVPMKFSEKVERAVRDLGPDCVEEVADDNLEKEKIPESVHETATRKARIARHDRLYKK